VEVKNNPATHDIPVILMSALQDVGKIAMECLVDSSISKPFDIEEISEMVHAYIG